MELFTAIAEFFQQASWESFLKFWNTVPLRDAEFWKTFWNSLWPRDGQMSFLSYTFWVFLAICAVLYYLSPRTLKPV